MLRKLRLQATRLVLFILIVLFTVPLSAQEQPRPVLTRATNSGEGGTSSSTMSWPSLMAETSDRGTPRFTSVPDTTLTYSVYGTTMDNDDVTENNALVCLDEASGNHSDNSYYRRFKLDQLTPGTEFTVTNVRIGVQEVVGSQSITVKLHTLKSSDPFFVDFLVPITSVNRTVNSSGTNVLNIPVFATIPAGYSLVLEVYTPDKVPLALEGQDVHFYPGTTTTASPNPDAISYIRAPKCGITQPLAINFIPFYEEAQIHLLMAVDGFTTLQPLLVNESIEGSLTDWTYTGPSDANSQMCKLPRAYHLICSWLVKGATQTRTIKQIVNLEDTVETSETILVVGALVSANTVTAKVDVKVRIEYMDGTVRNINTGADPVASLQLRSARGGNLYQGMTAKIDLEKDVRRVTVSVLFRNTATNSVNNLDYVTLRVIP